VSKEYTPKINIMDNQATKVVKAYLKPKDVSLQLVEPHSHRINAAEHAIQIFKNWFIGAHGTTYVNFPIQLWDKLMPQVQDSINLLCQLDIKPDVSVYETLEIPYNWNCYPMAPSEPKQLFLKTLRYKTVLGATRP
jgi:hypothetical protein